MSRSQLRRHGQPCKGRKELRVGETESKFSVQEREKTKHKNRTFSRTVGITSSGERKESGGG